MIGSTLSHYAIDAKIGQGGMGAVYRARDTVLGRIVAIKVLTLGATADPELGPRILREAKAASRLNHPNIVTVHELGRSDDTEFIVMEFVDGTPLSTTIAAGALPVARVVEYALQIADALAAAHEAGLVHRDVKPGNVMVTSSGRLKVLDFGLARQLPADPGEETRHATTEFQTAHGIAGTVGYMAPEQIEGQPANARSDVFSLGVVMYEMLTGQRPFGGDSAWATMQATVTRNAPDVTRLRADTPPALARMVKRALARRPEDRYASARELTTDLRALQVPSVAPSVGRSRRRFAVLAATLVAAGALGTAGWLWVRFSRMQWVRTVAIPELTRGLDAGDYDAAFRIGRQARQIAPDDVQLAHLWASVIERASITSEPSGAEVSVRGYLSKADWLPLGVTPLTQLAVPFGPMRWRITKPGYAPLEVSGAGHELEPFTLVATSDAHKGVVFVPRGPINLDTGSVELPEYWIDRFEVTNRQFKQFVDAGGYGTREYWTGPFVKDGRSLEWDQAIAEFRDATGRPGPSTWEIGAYPDGQDDFPVSGVSWYEAAAYAAFVHKRLPTVYHWYRASGAFSVFSDVLTVSNFSGRGTARVGESGGVGPFGTYDMAGNVKEWCWNATTTGRRFVLGGSFNDANYQFRDQDAQSPFERRPGFGLRLIEPVAAIEPKLWDPIVTVERDPASLKPVDDKVYAVYARQFDYDSAPLSEKVEDTTTTGAWRREKVSFAAAYGSERVPAYLFIPQDAQPPYQAIVFFPGTNALMIPSSHDLPLQFADFVVKSGRVLVYPIYQGTYERHLPSPEGPNAIREVTIQRGKDLRRTIDYLESRPDIDKTRIAFYGASLGAQFGPEYVAVEPRFKTAVFLSGGFDTTNWPPEVAPVNYAPRVRIPVLMVNGREDFDLPYATAQRPMFDLLGTPAADKHHAVLEGGHIPAARQEPIKEILNWLDRYLGPVKR